MISHLFGTSGVEIVHVRMTPTKNDSMIVNIRDEDYVSK